MSDLNQLTTMLFQTFNDVKEKKIDHNTAKHLNATAKNIVEVAKVQLEAMKHVKTTKVTPDLLGLGSAIVQHGEDDPDDTFENREKFALSLGYDSYQVAKNNLGTTAFNTRFKNEYKI